MITDIGEYLVGAYLKLVEKCDVIDYNVRPPGGGIEGLGELDVIGLNFKTQSATICEVTTHICGLQYGTNLETVTRIRAKHVRQKQYAKQYLKSFGNIQYQFWSPVVAVGFITENLSQVKTLELVINGEYKRRFEMLQRLAGTETHDTRNPVFRVLQIIGHLRS